MLSLRPAVLEPLERRAWSVTLLLACVMVVLVAPGRVEGFNAELRGGLWWGARWAAAAIGAAALVRVLLAFADRACRRSVVTREAVIAERGIVGRIRSEASLDRVQQISVVRSPIGRVLGLGSVVVETAGSSPGRVVLYGVRRPEKVASIVRRAERMARGRGMADGLGMSLTSASRPVRPGILVLGLAGGIGAGKSAVAAAMGTFGYAVIDSDKEAKAALDRPDVRDELVRWWGEGVLDASGRIDRRAVAARVFSDPDQRRRLEALVHPLVRQSRAAMIEKAVAAGAPGVVVDAPLLFEAGIEKECDAVVFVDCPREVRLQRVARTRGWDAAELDRREAAQLSVEEKRRRCRYVIVNDSEREALPDRARELLARIARDFGGGSVSGTAAG